MRNPVTHTLISFLGKGRDDPKTGYRTATYDFPDGRQRTTPFFGLGLCEYVDPSALVLLGTSSSMWDVLVEYLNDDGEDELRLELMDAVTGKRVDQALLDRLGAHAERGLGRQVRLRLITYGRSEGEQRDILGTIARAVPRGRVSFDLTHAFRHLAMLGLVSAFFLEKVGKLDIAGLYYGALDMTEKGVTPVLRLDGLNAIQRWVDALDRFDATGDYGFFAPLLAVDGVGSADVSCLEAAAFHERTFNLRDAARKLRTFLPVLDRPLPGASGVFQAKLGERLRWVKQESLHQQQRILAYVYLHRRDYVRAAVLAWEAILSRECESASLNVEDFCEDGDRSQAEAQLRAGLRQAGQRWTDTSHYRLKDLRNSLAHAAEPWSQEVRRVRAHSEALYKLMESDMKRALG
jgi:CRISPR-associated Csx2 family protein